MRTQQGFWGMEQGEPEMLSPGTMVNDRYEILGELGVGGFSVAYRARQVELEREVAIKMLLPWLSGHKDMLERFKREAMLVKNLNHPNTVRVHDFGVFQDKTLYLVMELLKGDTLDVHIDQAEGGFSLERVWHISHQILGSLAEAHSQGVIHRDLKPTNIFLTQVLDDPNFVKVMDFGISKTINDSELQSKPITEHGVVIGTPNYMSPESLQGNPCLGSDIFALGLLIVEMLAGEMVNSHERPLDAAQFIIRKEPIDIPDWIKQGRFGPILDRALDKNPAQRFPDARAMLAACQAADDGLVRKTKQFKAVEQIKSLKYEVDIMPEPAVPMIPGSDEIRMTQPLEALSAGWDITPDDVSSDVSIDPAASVEHVTARKVAPSRQPDKQPDLESDLVWAETMAAPAVEARTVATPAIVVESLAALDRGGEAQTSALPSGHAETVATPAVEAATIATPAVVADRLIDGFAETIQAPAVSVDLRPRKSPQPPPDSWPPSAEKRGESGDISSPRSGKPETSDTDQFIFKPVRATKEVEAPVTNTALEFSDVDWDIDPHAALPGWPDESDAAGVEEQDERADEWSALSPEPPPEQAQDELPMIERVMKHQAIVVPSSQPEVSPGEHEEIESSPDLLKEELEDIDLELDEPFQQTTDKDLDVTIPPHEEIHLDAPGHAHVTEKMPMFESNGGGDAESGDAAFVVKEKQRSRAAKGPTIKMGESEKERKARSSMEDTGRGEPIAPAAQDAPYLPKRRLPLWVEFLLVVLGCTALFVGAFWIFVQVFRG